MKGLTTATGELRTGCAMLFAAPFIALGIGVTYWLASVALEHAAMQSWVETPAKILSAELRQSRGRKGKSTYRALATYEYEFAGAKYRGDRVALLAVSDNFGGFQRLAHERLKRHHDSGQLFRCFVNPEKPAESILFPQLRWEFIGFLSIFGTVFGALGFGMLTGALVAARRMPAAVEAAPPDEPWKARADWASGQIASRAGSSVAVPVLGVACLWWFVASLPITASLPSILRNDSGRWSWLLLAYPAIGIVLLTLFVYHWLRRRKFGESVLQLAATPGVVGGQLAGVVRAPATIRADDGFRLKLSCLERRRGSDNRQHEAVAWQDERLINEPLRDIAAGTTSLPVLFAIPYEAHETSRPSSRRDVRWQLEASARTEGVDYRASFDVPVYKTAESRRDFQLDEKLVGDFAKPPSRDVVLREAGIVKESLPGGGVRLTFPAARNVGSAIVATLACGFVIAVVLFLRAVGVPLLIPIAIGLLAGPLVGWIALDLWFYRSVVEARREGLTFRGGLLGIGRTRFWPAEQVKRFAFSESMSTGSSVWKNVDVKLAGKEQWSLGRSIGSQPAQQAVIDELNAALGR